ncbi:hypothetical protein CLCR_10346 [Cladophialophora carrionii]|uniref:Uncharacterized protein n=1 Tax=Cladophialophora carrionii TaxID=86049 RepID=A0A1C1CVB4_9EURO|nr:hypothetical protein CLCR_10346 [Cladophialophora carrionii]
MSCRRRDRANLIGCNIGDVALRGCCQGCCPYPDDEKFEHTHPYLLKGQFMPSTETSTTQHRNPDPRPMPSGRTNLRFRSCETPHRPKFICLSRSCRRLFKPFFDPARFDYRVDRNEWSVRPRWDVTPELRAAGRLNASALPPATRRRMHELRGRLDAIESQKQQHPRSSSGGGGGDDDDDAGGDGGDGKGDGDSLEPGPLSDDDLAWLRDHDPEVWWTRVVGVGHDHAKRCPGCGGSGVRVGSNFRVPARKDERAWKELERMVSQGVDMLAEFEFCPTVEVWEEMAREAERVKRKEASGEGI